MIGLMDCNNFFVSCERLFRPDLWGKPVAVLSSNDGVIVARSNELKAMGVPMGLPLFQAKKLVDMSGVTLFSSNFTLYRDISSRVMQTLAAEVGECEIYSIDEAFFTLPSSVTEAELQALRTRIIQKVGIPVSIGVAATKTLAKVGSEIGKKTRDKDQEGVCFLTDESWQKVAIDFPCGEVWNLGRATASKLSGDGIKTAADFMNLDRAYVQKTFGVGGLRVQDELKGTVVHQVGCNSRDVQQSIMSTRSFAKATTRKHEVESALSYHITHVAEKLREKQLLATRLHVIARAGRHSDFSLRQGGTEVVLSTPTNSTKVLLKEALAGLNSFYDADVPYKKAGVVASGLVPLQFMQNNLFYDGVEVQSSSVLDQVTDSINRRFGRGALRPATLLDSGPKTSASLRSNEYTTAWKDIPRVVAK